MIRVDAWQALTQSDIDQLVEAAGNDDPDAALRIGESLIRRTGAGRQQAGDDRAIAYWLERAVELAGPLMMWRIAAMTKELYSYETAVHWQRAAISAEWRDSDIAVDENTFHLIPQGSLMSQDFTVRVTGEPPDAVREALTAATPRLMSVGDDGIEYEDPGVAPDSADYNPNFASDPMPCADGGWEVWMDCKGEAYPLMAATMLRILVVDRRF